MSGAKECANNYLDGSCNGLMSYGHFATFFLLVFLNLFDNITIYSTSK